MLVHALVVSFLMVFHPLYISTFHFTITPDQMWVAEIHMFYDDLEDGIQDQQGTRPNLSPTQIKRYQKQIHTYLSEHLSITDLTDDRHTPLSFQLKSCQREADLVILLLEGNEHWSDHVSIECTVLTALFGSQKNIFEVESPKGRDFFYLSRTDALHTLEIKD